MQYNTAKLKFKNGENYSVMLRELYIGDLYVYPITQHNHTTSMGTYSQV